MKIALFDLGNVVARWDPTPRFAGYARRAGISTTDVRRRLETDGFRADTDRGLYSSDQMASRISELVGFHFDRAELLALQAATFSPRPEILELARETRRCVPVGLLTNNPPLLMDAIPLHLPELTETFDPLLFSYQFRQVKPERGLFEAVQMQLGVDPADIFFVDDTSGHVEAARAAGWRAVQYESPEQLRRALQAQGLLDAGSVPKPCGDGPAD